METRPKKGYVSTLRFVNYCKSDYWETRRGRVPPARGKGRFHGAGGTFVPPRCAAMAFSTRVTQKQAINRKSDTGRAALNSFSARLR